MTLPWVMAVDQRRAWQKLLPVAQAIICASTEKCHGDSQPGGL
ncbi:Unknown protein sequence [Pseudomonas syringae pv. cilantro]|uniref:Uncharacterized protein n=1 Tax=Pseudomonas syringae pv. cilantro TaxID=81035 RepID=A0A0N0X7T2_PSESX|nr:Unknown protein sequence [Pseudomonas syringae pv. cilantro]